MAEFVVDCPRCGAIRSTHDVYSSVVVGMEYGWKQYLEVSGICRACGKMSIKIVSRLNVDKQLNGWFGAVGTMNTLSSYNGSLNDLVEFRRNVTLRDRNQAAPPDHVPKEIETVIREANACLASECWNAAAAMYRLALDMATKSLLPSEGEPSAKVRRSLGLRIQWLFDEQKLPLDLKGLADCLQQDGNDGAHDGTIVKEDADDLHDFCFELMRRLYTEPRRVELAEARRAARRQG
uniref:DUF4145 domain-containing protein n=1 Tax=Ruegeria arenilitoris TaxID=1173585 RepID=UPI00147EC425|nr:DUF4145 domain-containing protein [Ruegeria arenilitoris]